LRCRIITTLRYSDIPSLRHHGIRHFVVKNKKNVKPLGLTLFICFVRE